MLFQSFKYKLKSILSKESDETLQSYSQQSGDVNLSAVSKEVLNERTDKKRRSFTIGFCDEDFLHEI